MDAPRRTEHSTDLSGVITKARREYVACTSGGAATPWWDAVVVTASSARQAEHYREQIRQRHQRGSIPTSATYLVVADPEGKRIGSGGATLNALASLVESVLGKSDAETLQSWFAEHRVLIVHAGGDSRRLPQYSLSGKLFSVLPLRAWGGGAATVFDEMLTLSTEWAARLPGGLVVSSGDVILVFDASGLQWERPGVSGVAIPVAAEVGCQHGIYVSDGEGRVYSFLQKPTVGQVRAAGGLLDGEQVAVDTGLLRFDPAVAARLTELAGAKRDKGGWVVSGGIPRGVAGASPIIDLYRHFTLALTGQWAPKPDDDEALHLVAKALEGVNFWCDLVAGEFAHVGTTVLFRRLMTEDTRLSALYEARQRIGSTTAGGAGAGGVAIDCNLHKDTELGPGAIALECDIPVPMRIGRGAIVHGLSVVTKAVEVPEDTVVHEMPVSLPDGSRGTVIRAYGVDDDPKADADTGTATWFGKPVAEVLDALGIKPEDAWPDAVAHERTLWSALLFPLGSGEVAWACARWMMGLDEGYSAQEWRGARRLSLASSSQWADVGAIAEARARRLGKGWQETALALADAGSDIRPLLRSAPGLAAMAAAGRELETRAQELQCDSPTEAASRYLQAGVFMRQAGLLDEGARDEDLAFSCVQEAVARGVHVVAQEAALSAYAQDVVEVAAPARIDMGGGWSDTPPFCLDWGGTVLNIAVGLNGAYPVRTRVRRLDEMVVRFVSEDARGISTASTSELLPSEVAPGDPFAIPRAALQMTGMVQTGRPLPEQLAVRGGGLEIRASVTLPMGSGLGTSSILAATMLRALTEMAGAEMSDDELSDQVMCLEQMLTTGGGWQDQAGAIYPGAKLLTSGPGLRQRLRVQPLGWTRARQREFEHRFVLYYTGIQRMAKDLLRQIVGAYLARETATVQVLHSIKTLAVEMAHAMREGEWSLLGELLDRHWALNIQMDPNTTNAPIEALLREARPYLAGAKLAGAGGGGFLMLLAKDPESSKRLRKRLSAPDLPGELYSYEIAESGMQSRT